MHRSRSLPYKRCEFLAAGDYSVIDTRTIAAGGTAAVEADGRPLPVTSAMCVAVIDDRRGTHRCMRQGWFALRETSGEITQPMCATHLRTLSKTGGRVLAPGARAR